jgi:hypothetical protein
MRTKDKAAIIRQVEAGAKVNVTPLRLSRTAACMCRFVTSCRRSAAKRYGTDACTGWMCSCPSLNAAFMMERRGEWQEGARHAAIFYRT